MGRKIKRLEVLSRAEGYRERQPASEESGRQEVLEGRSPAFLGEVKVPGSSEVGKGSGLKGTFLPQLVLVTGE